LTLIIDGSANSKNATATSVIPTIIKTSGRRAAPETKNPKLSVIIEQAATLRLAEWLDECATEKIMGPN